MQKPAFGGLLRFDSSAPIVHANLRGKTLNDAWRAATAVPLSARPGAPYIKEKVADVIIGTRQEVALKHG